MDNLYVFILIFSIFCVILIGVLIVFLFKAREKCKVTNERFENLLNQNEKLEQDLKQEQEWNDKLWKDNSDAMIRNAELNAQLVNAGIDKEWKEQHQKEMVVINKAIQDKMLELQTFVSACDTTKKEVEELELNKEQLQHKILQFNSDIENLEILLRQKQAAWSAVDNFEKCGFGDELPYIDYEEYFSKNNFEIVLKLLDDCIDVAPQFKSELRKIEWNLCYLPYKKTFIKDFSRSGIYMLEVKSKYENEVLKELGLKRVDDNGSIVYIGQAVNVYDRWTTHIKKMLGIEAAGGEKIYKFKPLMFKWKVIEWCDSSELNEREKFWIDSFKSDELGLNSKGGNK